MVGLLFFNQEIVTFPELLGLNQEIKELSLDAIVPACDLITDEQPGLRGVQGDRTELGLTQFLDPDLTVVQFKDNRIAGWILRGIIREGLHPLDLDLFGHFHLNKRAFSHIFTFWKGSHQALRHHTWLGKYADPDRATLYSSQEGIDPDGSAGRELRKQTIDLGVLD